LVFGELSVAFFDSTSLYFEGQGAPRWAKAASPRRLERFLKQARFDGRSRLEASLRVIQNHPSCQSA
jgi:hypothetical protein